MLLEVRNLNVEFAAPRGGSVSAVRDVSFAIDTGKTLGLVGESGSGKSVTSLAVMRLLPPQARISGEILFEGTDLLALDDDRMRDLRGTGISMIFQEPMTALNPVMRIGDQVAEAVLAHGKVTKKDAWTRAVEALTHVGIPDPERRARDYPFQLSGGQRQRVMIAMAIVNRPRLLIADEPTTALDVTIQAQILDLLNDLRHKFGLAMLFISHDLGVIARMADEVAVMYGGSIMEKAPLRQIFSAAQHPYTKGLLACIPSLRTDRTQPLRTVDHANLEKATEPALVEIAPGHLVRR